MINHTSLIYANFFFTDIVGLSDPRMSTKTQIKKIEVLNKLIKECIAFKTTSKDSLIVPSDWRWNGNWFLSKSRTSFKFSN